MTDVLEPLLAAPDFQKLREYEKPPPRFDVFQAANLHLGENRSSWILANLCSTRGAHGLGRRFLEGWLGEIERIHESDFPLAGLSWDHAEAGVEWVTSKNRRVDILIRLFDAEDQVVGVMGVENKHWALEQKDQVKHYQGYIAKSFEGIPCCVLFLTPSGRDPETKGDQPSCPWLAASWRTALRAMSAVESGAPDLVRAFIESVRRILIDEMEYHEMSETKKSLKPLVERLYRDPETRQAILLLEQLRPRATTLLEGVHSRLPWDSGSFDTRPKKASQFVVPPVEARWYPPDLEASVDGWSIYLAYGLLATKAWDSGRNVRVAALAWVDGESGREKLRSYQEKMTTDRPTAALWDPREDLEDWFWSSWAPLWIGEKHTLGALLDEDRDKLLAMVTDAHDRTHDWLKGNLRSLGWLKEES